MNKYTRLSFSITPWYLSPVKHTQVLPDSINIARVMLCPGAVYRENRRNYFSLQPNNRAGNSISSVSRILFTEKEKKTKKKKKGKKNIFSSALEKRRVRAASY